jgi:hypothetical protein
VTTLEIERFPAPETSCRARTVELMRLRAAEQLEGKAVWCVAAALAEVGATDALARCLLALGEVGVASRQATLAPQSL